MVEAHTPTPPAAAPVEVTSTLPAIAADGIECPQHVGIVGLGLTELLMWLLTGKAGIHYLVAKVITTVIVFVWNFSAKKLILFRSK